MMAALLQFRLKRLEAMRRAAMQLMNRPLLGRQVFARGEPEPITDQAHAPVGSHALRPAQGLCRSSASAAFRNDYTPLERHVWSLQDARDILKRLIGDSMDWVPLDAYLADYPGAPRAAPDRHGLDLRLQP